MPLPVATRLVVPKMLAIQVVSTEEFLNQKPGQLGLFLPKSQFKRKHFVENYVQSVFDAFGAKIAGSTIVLGTDGSALALTLTRLVLRLAAGNGVGRVVVGVGARLSAPALSVVLREHDAAVVVGFYMSGDGGRGGGEQEGEEENANNERKGSKEERDKFAIQTFLGNGGLASEDFNRIIFKKTRYITKYRVVNEFPPKLFDAAGIRETFVEGRGFHLEVVDPLESYVNCLSDFFDFTLLRLWATRFPKRVVVGVGGGQMEMYAKKIFGDLLGVKAYAFVECRRGTWKDGDKIGDVKEIYQTLRSDTWDFGVSLSPDGRRCGFLSADGHVMNPGAMLALVAERARFLPGLRPSNNTGAAATATTTATAVSTGKTTSATNASAAPKGFARTATTSRDIDGVAFKRRVEMHVTPPEWRHVGALLDAGRVAIFGDDAFQMGSFHARVPDGIWATLAVMTILAVAEAEDGGAQVEEEEEEEEEEKEVEEGEVDGEAKNSAKSSDEVASLDFRPAKKHPSSPRTTPPSSPRATPPSPRATPPSPLTTPLAPNHAASHTGAKIAQCPATLFYLSLLTQNGAPSDGAAASASASTLALSPPPPPPPPPARIADPLRRILERHWEEFGRHYCARMDYESLDRNQALEIFESLQMKIRTPIMFAHAWFHHGPRSYQVLRGEEFQYFDPVEVSSTLTTNCIRIFLHDGSIIAFRLCSAEDGLNFRIYIDKFEDSVFKMKYSQKATLQPLVNIAEEMCGFKTRTGKTRPDSKI